MDNGRPPLFSSPDELEAKIEEYFATGIKERTVVVGPPNNRQSVTLQVPTITGLAYFLGFESRQSFYDYEKRDGFSYIIKRARLYIEVEYEEALQYGNTTGAIFALKNMGWKDSTAIDHTTKGDKIQQGINLSTYTDDELRTIAELQRKGRVSASESE